MLAPKCGEKPRSTFWDQILGFLSNSHLLYTIWIWVVEELTQPFSCFETALAILKGHEYLVKRSLQTRMFLLPPTQTGRQDACESITFSRKTANTHLPKREGSEPWCCAWPAPRACLLTEPNEWFKESRAQLFEFLPTWLLSSLHLGWAVVYHYLWGGASLDKQEPGGRLTIITQQGGWARPQGDCRKLASRLRAQISSHGQGSLDSSFALWDSCDPGLSYFTFWGPSCNICDMGVTKPIMSLS